VNESVTAPAVNMPHLPVDEGRAWGIVLARGGSKSIPLKNLALLDGRPLIDYVLAAGAAATTLERLICSTDHAAIAAAARSRGAALHHRPAHLATDDAHPWDALAHLLEEAAARDHSVADILCVLQPTSPFVLPEDLDAAVTMLRENPEADSVQTVTTLTHNHHAFNQRVIESGYLRFRFPDERRVMYNKQRKPTHYVFGNLLVTRTRTLFSQHDLWGQKSLPRIIPSDYAADIDQPEDLGLAEWLLHSQRVRLPHFAP